MLMWTEGCGVLDVTSAQQLLPKPQAPAEASPHVLRTSSPVLLPPSFKVRQRLSLQYLEVIPLMGAVPA